MSLLYGCSVFTDGAETSVGTVAAVRTGVGGRLPAVGVPGMYTEKGVEGQNVGVGAVADVAAVVVVVADMLVADDFAGCVADVDKLNSLKPVKC